LLSNHLYNLMAQLVEENKSLWRINNKYMVDTEGCEECKVFFEKLAAQKETVIAELAALIKTQS
jgi:hypothetical protein